MHLTEIVLVLVLAQVAVMEADKTEEVMGAVVLVLVASVPKSKR
jgi:hypothetical protein